MTTQRSAIPVVGLLLLGASLSLPSEASASEPGPYSGGLLDRSTASGDWGGSRNVLAARGVTFDATVTQITQGVVDGGKSGRWEYGGRGDLTLNLDTQKLGLWPGGFLSLELEGSWGDSVNGNTGSLNPVDSNQLFPVPNDSVFAVPNLTFAQFLSPYGGVIVGKLQTISAGDPNEFAHGKGDTRFFNLAFNVNPVTLAVPYSTLGAGAIVLPTANPDEAMVNLSVLSARGSPTTAGFDDFAGAIFSASGRLRTDFFGRTGHQFVGALYSNASYTSIDQRLDFDFSGVQLQRKNDTWSVYYNFDQFVWETERGSAKGVGVFGRFGASAGDPVPERYFVSFGVGGKGMIAGREHDRFGIGYYYVDVSNPTLQIGSAQRSFLRDEWGFEAFYNLALTPWMLLTPDLQVIGPAQRRKSSGSLLADGPYIGTATVIGVRLQLVL